MGTHRNGRGYECVLVDVNTQRDLCEQAGAFPVANRSALFPALRRVIAWVKRNHAPLISSVECHRRWELADAGPHGTCCIDGTGGQRKIEFTILPCCTRVEVDNTLSVPLDLFARYQQVIFRKRSEDLLGNPKADRFLTQLPAREYILFGTGIERWVKALALGLLARDKRVTIVVDACGYWNQAAAELALRQIAAKGGTLITVDELLSRKLDRCHRYSIAVRAAGAGLNGNRRVRGTPVNGTGRKGRLADSSSREAIRPVNGSRRRATPRNGKGRSVVDGEEGASQATGDSR